MDTTPAPGMRPPRPASEIDPRRHYSPRMACEFIPSKLGGTLHPNTWHKWRVEGLFRAVQIGTHWYMTGAELLKLLHAQQPVEVPPAAQPGADESLRRDLRAQGFAV